MGFVLMAPTAEMLPRVSLFLMDTFETFLGPNHTEEGIASFRDVVSLPSLGKHLADGDVMLMAMEDDQLAGFLGMAGTRHLKFLFVGGAFHRRGAARLLWRSAKQLCLAQDAGEAPFSVNASDYAVQAYQRLGFQISGERQLKNGIIFTPLQQASAPTSPN